MVADAKGLNYMEIKIKLVPFYSKGDEGRLFQGLKDIPAIADIVGVGQSLVFDMDIQQLNDDMLRELIALLWRYGISLRPLSELSSDGKFTWIKNDKFFWYKNMFE